MAANICSSIEFYVLPYSGLACSNRKRSAVQFVLVPSPVCFHPSIGAGECHLSLRLGFVFRSKRRLSTRPWMALSSCVLGLVLLNGPIFSSFLDCEICSTTAANIPSTVCLVCCSKKKILLLILFLALYHYLLIVTSGLCCVDAGVHSSPLCYIVFFFLHLVIMCTVWLILLVLSYQRNSFS